MELTLYLVVRSHYILHDTYSKRRTSFIAWTMSILGAGSMIGSMACGYITSYISARIALTLLYLIRVILIAIFVFVPISLSTVLAFSVIFGVS
jgi:predicted MFS family arabinose efflux permease